MKGNPSDVDLKREQLSIHRGVGAASVVCSVVYGAAYLLSPPSFNVARDDLPTRLIYWAGANLGIVVWIMIGVGIVSYGRRHSLDDIRGSAYSTPSPRIAVAVAFLQNTLEQSVLAMFTMLALILLTRSNAMPFIAASIILFALGRVTFLCGYPKGAGGRSFGMAVTAIPSITAFIWAVGSMIYRLWT